MDARCKIELLGGLRVQQGDRVITRFSGYKAASLLAYLAYYLRRQHPREVLIEILWPESELEAGRNRLSVALSSLRHQLEPPGVPAGAVLIADRASVRLNPSAVTPDVTEFEGALSSADRARGSAEREQDLLRAVELYRGPLLSGYYEEWIPSEQERLAERYLQALRQLIPCAEQAGDLNRAIDYARRAIAADPLREESYQDLMRLHVAAAQPSAALRQFQELERILDAELGQAPSPATLRLAEEIRRSESGVQASGTEGEKGRVPAERVAGVGESRQRQDGPVSDSPTPLLPLSPSAPEHLKTAPSGTVTFLLTDIERSTARWEQAGDVFKTALATHHALLRREFRRHGGYEVQEAGDSFLVAFDRAGDALACAIAGQQALTAHRWPEEVGPLRVRMALHTGDVERGDGGYHGLVLHHASRMLTASHGGQILCSETTAGLLRRGGIAVVDPGVRLSDLGVYRLRDITTPERLLQVEYPEMGQREFPPPNAEAGYAGSLPLQFTRFFGREAELAQLRALLLSDTGVGQAVSLPSDATRQADSLPHSRLITLTGTGGSGKTRLALQAAGQLVDAFQGAVWFVSLADLSDARLIAEAVRDALRLPRSPYLTAVEQVVEFLGRQPSLLLLDNFEHLVAEGAAFVRALLESAPTLKCLVTSRRLLGLDGEREFPVPPLPTPAGTATPERLSLYESVQLFVDRAQTVRPDFQVTKNNAAAVAELCARLEGIPLALELAAARAQVLTPAQMLDQLSRRFDFLVSRRRDAVDRHRTLRAAIAWGYDLLALELQRFFAALSVFRGGWTLEAAEAVCSGVQDGQEPVPENAQHLNAPDVLDYLAQLRECSLIVGEESATGMRFRMLETLREYAAEQLAPEEHTALARRHGEYCLSLVAQTYLGGAGDLQERQTLERLEADRDNFRAALEWALGSDTEFALRLAVAFAPFWQARYHWSEGRALLGQCVARAGDAPADLRAGLLSWAGRLAKDLGDFEDAKALLGEGCRFSRETGDQRTLATALGALGNIAWLQFEVEHSRALLRESLTLWRVLGDDQRIVEGLDQLSIAVGMPTSDAPADLVAEEELRVESLDLARRIGYRPGIARALHMLGMHAAKMGEYAEARRLGLESLALWRQLNDEGRAAYPLTHLGRLACRDGDYAGARALLHESIRVFQRLGDKRMIAECLDDLGEVARLQNQAERAARLFGAAEALRETMHRGSKIAEAEYAAHVARLRQALGEAPFAAAWAEGRALTWQQAAEYAVEEQ